MRWADMYIAGTGDCLPGREDTELAVAEGRYDELEYELNGYVSASVADGLSAPDMAVRAARTAMARSGVAGEEIALVLHADIGHQGVDHWTPASYVQRLATGGGAPSMEVRQASNGGLAALALAMAQLTVDPDGAAALITTSDVFGLPLYDRYRADKWFVLGDGGTAAVVSRKEGFARVLSSAMGADPELEGMYRGAEGFYDVPGAGGLPIDLRARKEAFLEQTSYSEVSVRVSAGLGRVVEKALRDADADVDDISCFVLPNVGRSLLQWQILDDLGVGEERTTWDWGREVGHLGAGDQLGGLNYLVEQHALRRGDRVALLGSGIGFNWNCVVLEIIEPQKLPAD